MIEVRSQYRPERQRVEVYMFDRERGQGYIYNPEGMDRIVDISPQTELPVYLSLPESAVVVIQRALEGETWKIPQPATARHLEDAIEVRDKMIGLVEMFSTRLIDSQRPRV